MISNKEVKRSFKIVLDSFNTNSYVGSSQFDCNYYIDLTKIINDESAFDKSYYVYCELINTSNNVSATGISSTNIYTLDLNFNGIGGKNIYQYDMSKNYSFILPVQNVTDVGGTMHTYFNLSDNQQKPLFLQNIRNMTNIYFKVYETNDLISGIFAPTSTGLENFKYICILSFVEA